MYCVSMCRLKEAMTDHAISLRFANLECRHVAVGLCADDGAFGRSAESLVDLARLKTLGAKSRSR